MAIVANLPNLNEAVQQANQFFLDKSYGYSVVVTNEKVEPKSPVNLQLNFADGKSRNVGIIHLVQLKGKDWDNIPFEKIARTTEEVAQSILDRIALFFAAEKQGLYIDENGTIFDFKNVEVKQNEDKTFSVNGTLVTYGDKSLPLALNRIRSEAIVEFFEVDVKGETHIQLFDALDQREGKGMFVNTAGKLYRA